MCVREDRHNVSVTRVEDHGGEPPGRSRGGVRKDRDGAVEKNLVDREGDSEVDREGVLGKIDTMCQ